MSLRLTKAKKGVYVIGLRPHGPAAQKTFITLIGNVEYSKRNILTQPCHSTATTQTSFGGLNEEDCPFAGIPSGVLGADWLNMAGTYQPFNADKFRAAIRFTFHMAADVQSGGPWFHFADELTNVTPAAGDHVPFNPNVAAAVVSRPAVQVVCGVAFVDVNARPTPFGLMAATDLKITLLDQEWELVKDCVAVTLGGDTYEYRRTEPPGGLFDVGVYAMIFVAVSET